MRSDLSCRQGTASRLLRNSEFSFETPMQTKHGHFLSHGEHFTVSGFIIWPCFYQAWDLSCSLGHLVRKVLGALPMRRGWRLRE